jgi:hypothetical protein
MLNDNSNVNLIDFKNILFKVFSEVRYTTINGRIAVDLVMPFQYNPTSVLQERIITNINKSINQTEGWSMTETLGNIVGFNSPSSNQIKHIVFLETEENELSAGAEGIRSRNYGDAVRNIPEILDIEKNGFYLIKKNFGYLFYIRAFGVDIDQMLQNFNDGKESNYITKITGDFSKYQIIKSSKISFVFDDLKPIIDFTGAPGTIIELSSIPTPVKAGYIFNSWVSIFDEPLVYLSGFTIGENNTTIKAKFSLDVSNVLATKFELLDYNSSQFTEALFQRFSTTKVNQEPGEYYSSISIIGESQETQALINYLQGINPRFFDSNNKVNVSGHSPAQFLYEYFATGKSANVFTSGGQVSLKNDAAIVVQEIINHSLGFKVWTGDLNATELALYEKYPEWFIAKENGYYLFDYGDSVMLYIRSIDLNGQALLNDLIDRKQLTLPFKYYRLIK